MKNNNVYLLYKFTQGEAQADGAVSASYSVVLLFNPFGEVNLSQYKKIVEQFEVDLGSNQLEFSTKEVLNNFATELVAEMNHDAIYLLSANDYNIGIESCHDLSSFREIFHRYGVCIESKPTDSSNKGLFGKFF